MKSGLCTLQVESKQATLHTKHKLGKKKTPSPPQEKKGGPFHYMTQLLTRGMEILFLKLATTIFGMD
jgi:hypothetical protein